LNGEPVGADAADLRAQLVEQITEIAYMGSLAALSITVSPAARTAAISVFSVAVTLASACSR
jgi:hypothetical protein